MNKRDLEINSNMQRKPKIHVDRMDWDDEEGETQAYVQLLI